MNRHYIPSEAMIVSTFHQIGALHGYDPDDCVPQAITALTPTLADDAQREAISALVRRVWVRRFEIGGAF